MWVSRHAGVGANSGANGRLDNRACSGVVEVLLREGAENGHGLCQSITAFRSGDR